MKNITIEKFYQKIKKKIKLISAYLDKPSYEFLITSCRMKPLSVFLGNFSFKKISLEPVWLDEFGNALIVKDNSTYLHFDYYKAPLLSTDLYRNKGFHNFLENNKLMAYSKQNERKIVAFLSEELMWRAWEIKEQDLIICSPLLLGLEFLKFAGEQRDIKEMKQFMSGQYLVPKYLQQEFMSDHIETRRMVANG